MRISIENIMGLLGTGVFWSIMLLGSPVTFIWLIAEDAERYHSFGAWVLLVMLDISAAAMWPIYWIGRFISCLL